MIIELTEEEYKGTMVGGMVDITETAEPIVNIWPYVEELTTKNIDLGYVYEQELVESVYGNAANTCHHVLLPTNERNVFVIIIVDVKAAQIKGHFYLDLNSEYGLK
jgi:hypothetical protein